MVWPGGGQRSYTISIQQCEKNEVVLGRAHQPPQRRPLDLASHHYETMRKETHNQGDQQSGGEMTWTRPAQILEAHDLAGDTTRQAISVARSCGFF